MQNSLGSLHGVRCAMGRQETVGYLCISHLVYHRVLFTEHQLPSWGRLRKHWCAVSWKQNRSNKSICGCICVLVHVYMCAYLYVLCAHVCEHVAAVCEHACVHVCLPVLLGCSLLFSDITYSAPLNFMKVLQYLNYLKIHVLYKTSE